MKAEAWVFGIATAFYLPITAVYWLVTSSGGSEGEWIGTTAFGMTGLLAGMITLYLAFHAKKMDPRPEDRLDAEIVDGAGELGFFPPYSWWPLWCGLTLGVMVMAIAYLAWWLFIMALSAGAIALSGLVFEYYRGEHAH